MEILFYRRLFLVGSFIPRLECSRTFYPLVIIFWHFISPFLFLEHIYPPSYFNVLYGIPDVTAFFPSRIVYSRKFNPRLKCSRTLRCISSHFNYLESECPTPSNVHKGDLICSPLIKGGAACNLQYIRD